MVENVIAVIDVIVQINVCAWESVNVNINALAKVNVDVVQIVIV